MLMSKRIWITWEIQRRNRSMSSSLNAELHEITSPGPRWKRYYKQIFRTIKTLHDSKANLVFAQNPSLLLSLLVVLYGKVTNKTVVLDIHNAGIFPLEGKNRALNQIAKQVNSLSTKAIVSNSALIPFINKNRKDVFAIPDPIPDINKNADYILNNGTTNLVFICSWSLDEPYKEVFEIAENLEDTVHIYVTGNSKGKEKNIRKKLPANITLTGFLSNVRYDDLIHSCDAIMVLTTRDDCLVCGAYEGVAVEKPMVLSNTKAIVNHFNKGCVYTVNTGKNIEASIRQLVQNSNRLSQEITILKQELISDSQSIISKLNDNLNTNDT